MRICRRCGTSQTACRHLASGDDLVDPGGSLGPDQIFSSDNAAIAAAVAAWDGEPIDLGIAPDRMEAIAGAINAAIGADLLVTIGGASVGEHDLVRNALETSGFKPGFRKVAMRPGKTVIFGTIGQMRVLGLSGNPSLGAGDRAHVPASSYRGNAGLARKTNDLRADNQLREDYVRARLERDPGGKLIALPFPTQDSATFLTLANADGLIRRPPRAPAAPKGALIDVIVFDHLGSHF